MKKHRHFLSVMLLLAAVVVYSYPAAAFLNAGLSANEEAVSEPDFSMTGYATVASQEYRTTTGGAGGNIITIRTLQELENWAASRENNSSPEIVYISGKISADASTVITIKRGANVSVLGLGSTAELENVGLNFRNYKNVIIRNIKIHEVFYPNDGLTIDACEHVWIDHNEFHSIIGEGIGVDTYDGLMDIKNGSRFVTVSWNHFHDHMKTVLIGHTDNANAEATDREIRVTFHHNFFENTDGRNPSLRWGAVHMYNNYFKNISDYGIAIRQGAHALLENNVYENVKLPVSTNKFTGEGYACERGNLFTGTSGNNSITQTDCDWWNATTLPYNYTPDPVDEVAAVVAANAGTGLTDPAGDGGEIPEPEYRLSLSVTGEGTVNPSGGLYAEGATVALNATPAAGFTFNGWSGDAGGTDNPLTITMDNNKTVVANFASAGGGGGTSGDKVQIPATFSGEMGLCSYDGSLRTAGSGTVINLSNTAGKGITWKVEVLAAGNYELQWRYAGGGSSAVETAKLLINGTTALENVTFPKPDGSTSYLTTSPVSVPLIKGVNQVRIETIESAAFADIEWIEVSGDGVFIADCSFEIGSENVIAEPRYYSVTATSQPSGGGTVSFSPEGGYYEKGTELTITAVQAGGYAFTEWSGDLSGTASGTTIVVQEDMEITAIFTPIRHRLVTEVKGEGTIAGAADSFQDGEAVILTAEAGPGWQFEKWEGSAEGNANPLTITMHEDVSVTAVFTEVALGIAPGSGENDMETQPKMYPNPFNGSTTFEVTLSKRGEIKISLFRADGKLVQEVINKTFDAGTHKPGYINHALSPGVYFYLVETANGKYRKKLLVE